MHHVLDNVSNTGVLTVPKSGSHRPIPAHVLKTDFLFTLCAKRHLNIKPMF